MNATTQELTSSLQELTARTPPRAHHDGNEATRGSLAPDQLTFSQGIQVFLDRSQAYAAETRAVDVGSY